ncbi:arginine--tRNA ligase [Ectothiorhodospiraceae bacterium BW-2]|nr:arginine--tRNA ligase [Ectothiorhodospiraceae bacterium BW-2]
MNVKSHLSTLLATAMEQFSISIDDATSFKEATNPRFGDYQTNIALVQANRRGEPPRIFAEAIIDTLKPLAPDICFEIAGAGFINAKLTAAFITSTLSSLLHSPSLGVSHPSSSAPIVVDYSHPNLAKEMHVGHLRSTIIGDTIVKVLEFTGHSVIRHNHMGDWGTQFGMLIAYLDECEQFSGERSLADLEGFYRAAKRRFDEDPDFKTKAREFTVRLQQGDGKCRDLWQRFISTSIEHCAEIYDKLDVSLRREDVVPESFYNDDLPRVIDDLRHKDLITESEGALCVFLDEFKNDNDEVVPVIVQKSDGGFLYSTTDLAAIRYRANVLKAQRIIYVVDSRQTLHLQQVFAVARHADFLPPQTSLEHMPFGTMMGKDGKPFKTRQGDTVKLLDLLNEAEHQALSIIEDKNPDLEESEKRALAHTIGIGAVKYADLSKARTNDYIFDLQSMLSLEGNTAPYLQYAYTRIVSIFRKIDYNPSDADLSADYSFQHPNERTLAVSLTRFSETVEAVAHTGMPHLLCNYLYSLAKHFMSFYESCPISTEADQSVREARLALCHGSSQTLKVGLSLLGIAVVERM